jgi:hypothetical protein
MSADQLDTDQLDQLDPATTPTEGGDQVDDDTPARPPFDPMAELTLAELDSGSRLLKASIVEAITARTQHYERALPIVVWLWARRTDRNAQLGDFTAMTWQQLHDRLAAMAPEASADPEGPTAPGPAS